MKKTIVLIALAVLATQTKAETAAQATSSSSQAFLQLSLTPDIALHSKDTNVRGISLSIWGENPQHSLTLGIVNGSTGDSSGFGWGAVNYAESYTGVQWAFVNISKTSFLGWQGAAINYSQGTFTGLQSGFVNFGQEVKGVQFGCFNYAETLDGVQVGFLNIAKNNGWFDEFPDKLATAFPFVNWSF
jgi:hypothetical protein